MYARICVRACVMCVRVCGGAIIESISVSMFSLINETSWSYISLALMYFCSSQSFSYLYCHLSRGGVHSLLHFLPLGQT